MPAVARQRWTAGVRGQAGEESPIDNGVPRGIRGMCTATSSTMIVMLSRPPFSSAASSIAVDGVGGIGVLVEEMLDAVVGELLREPVRADHEAIAVDDIEAHVVGRHALARPDGPRDDVAVGVVLGLFGAEAPCGDELLHDGVVGRDLLDHSVAHEVDARVADVERDPLRRTVAEVEVHAGQRRARAVVGGLRVRCDVLHRARERLLDRLRRHVPGFDDARRGGRPCSRWRSRRRCGRPCRPRRRTADSSPAARPD